MLKLKNVSKYYHSGDVVALGLRKVNLEFKLGEFIAVTGESGSGKSTLLNVISGLDTYEDGEMYVNDEETSYFSMEEWESYRRQYIGFVFQNYNIIDSYSVLENVMVALTIQGYDKATRKERALELIDKVGLSTHVHHKASKLSGGQKQRAVIARALAKDCPIIVCDEPTGNLDSKSADNIMRLLKEISQEKLVIVVTHNYDEVKEYATRRIRLFDGEVVEDKKIKPRSNVTESVTLASYFMNYATLSGIALKNLVRTPRRTIFTMIIAIFIGLIFTFSYGSYVKETSGNNNFFGGGYFNNVTESRIIINKFDSSKFTQEEINQINAIARVRYVNEHDVVLDSQFFTYEEDSDYIWEQNVLVNPAAQLREKDLLDGRLPESEFEIVVEDKNDYTIGQKIPLGYEGVIWKDGGSDLPDSTEDYTIVGKIKPQQSSSWMVKVFFHEDFFESPEVIARAYTNGRWGEGYVQFNTYITVKDEDMMPYIYEKRFFVDNTLADNEVKLSSEAYYQMAEVFGPDFEDTMDGTLDGVQFRLEGVSPFYTTDNTLTIKGNAVDVVNFWGSGFYVNEATYNKLIQLEPYQMSVMVLDSYDAELVMKELDDLGFNTIYPNAITNQFDEIFGLFSAIWFGVLMVILMIVIYFISYVVLRNVQNAKKKDYLIFRSIGASKVDLNKVTILELVFTVVMAYIVTMGLLVVNELFTSPIPQFLRYFTPFNYALILIMLIALALLLGNRFNRKIFSTSVITSLKQE